MINAGKAAIEYKKGEYDQRVSDEFLFIQPPWNKKIGIQIIEGYQQNIVEDKKGGQIPF